MNGRVRSICRFWCYAMAWARICACGTGKLQRFSEHFRVLRYDTRGHGQSGVTPGPYTIEQLSRDVVRLLDAVNIDRACFCGLSMGGLIGMFLGTNEANRFHKIVLSSTAAKIATADVVEHAHPVRAKRRNESGGINGDGTLVYLQLPRGTS